MSRDTDSVFLVEHRDGTPYGIVDMNELVDRAKALLRKLAEAGRDPAEANRIVVEVRQSVDDETAAAWIVGIASRLITAGVDAGQGAAAHAVSPEAVDALRERFREFRHAALAKRGGGR